MLWFKLFALHKHFPPLAQCARKYGVLARNMCEAQLRRMKCWAEVGVLAQTQWRCAMARWLDAINVPDSPENLSFHSTKCIVLINDILSLLIEFLKNIFHTFSRLPYWGEEKLLWSEVHTKLTSVYSRSNCWHLLKRTFFCLDRHGVYDPLGFGKILLSYPGPLPTRSGRYPCHTLAPYLLDQVDTPVIPWPLTY